LLLALFVPSSALADTWQLQAGAESPDRGRQALAFLPNEIWIRAGDSIRWTFPTHERHTVQRICRAISDETGRDTVRLDPKTLVETLNRMLIGWANYFCLGAVSKAYSAVDMHARRRLRRWLCDKHNEPRPGYKRFPEANLHSVYGLVQLPHRTASLPWAQA
jgi:plastocyanin